jgi:HEAT repeat protein
MIKDYQQEIRNMNSGDPDVRKAYIEKYLYEEIPDELIKELTQKLYDDDIAVRDTLAMVFIQSENPAISEHIVPFVSSESISTRNLVGEILLNRGEKSVEAMLNYLQDSNSDDKKFIIDILGLIGSDKSVDKIIEILRKDSDENVILACIEALGNIGSEKSIEELIYKYEANDLFKPSILEALGKIGSDQASDFMLEKYHVEDELIKFPIIEGLGKVGNEKAFFLLVSDIKNLSGPLTWAAVETLWLLEKKLNTRIPFDNVLKNATLSTLQEGETHQKKAAANFVNHFNDTEIVDACLDIYGVDVEVDENIKNKFLENPEFIYPILTYYISRHPENTSQLLYLIKEMIQSDGGKSIRSISEIDFRDFCDLLTRLLENTDEEVRRIAMELLFFCSLETAILFLDTMSEDENIWNKMMLLEILDQLDQEEGNQIILKMSSDDESMVQEKAIELLKEKNLYHLYQKAENNV